jgi:hypothetical protein
MAFSSLALGGGRLSPKYSKYPPTEYRTAEFVTDHTVAVIISFKLLHEGVTGRKGDNPIMMPLEHYRLNFQNPKNNADTPNMKMHLCNLS